MAPKSAIGATAGEPEGGSVPVRRSAPRALAVLLLALAFLASCAARAPQSPGAVPATPVSPTAKPGPLLWRADHPGPGGGALYLFGSVHVGAPDMVEFGSEVDAAYAVADELVVEVDLSSLTPEAIAEQSLAYVLLPEGESLRDLVSVETWDLLEEQLRSYGVGLTAGLHRMKPWAVTTFLAMMQFEAAGLHEQYGVDKVFIHRAAGTRPIRGLETLQSQMEILDGLPLEIQDLMLADTLRRLGEDPSDLLRAWERGDEAALTRIVFGPLEDHPEYAPFYEALFFGRNEAMVAQLAELAGDGRQRFVVLGAGHMLGARGIPALLVDRGYRVERITGL